MSGRYDFDRFENIYAHRTGSMVSSEIRDLLSMTERPDIISFAGGLPFTQMMDMENIANIFHTMMRAEGAAALQYGPTEGLVRLKDELVCIMRAEGLEVLDDDILITNGSQQGLDLLSKIFINPGDVVLTEAPSYAGALNSFVSYQPRLRGVPLDDDGLRVDLLERELEALTESGVKPKFLYTVPSFHNPAGVTLSLERRHRLVEAARRFDLLIIEDNPYGLLRFEGELLPPLKALDNEHVVYLGTISKILSAGMRVGWAAAPPPIMEKLILAKQSADLCTSSMTQRLAQAYFSTQDWRLVVDQLTEIYKGRRDAMLEALSEFFPDAATWTRPQGGFFLWVKLPRYINTSDMLAAAIERKVAYVPGAGFFPDRSGTNYMRLNFSYPPEEKIWEGIKRLSAVIKREMQLAKSLGLAESGDEPGAAPGGKRG